MSFFSVTQAAILILYIILPLYKIKRACVRTQTFFTSIWRQLFLFCIAAAQVKFIYIAHFIHFSNTVCFTQLTKQKKKLFVCVSAHVVYMCACTFVCLNREPKRAVLSSVLFFFCCDLCFRSWRSSGHTRPFSWSWPVGSPTVCRPSSSPWWKWPGSWRSVSQSSKFNLNFPCLHLWLHNCDCGPFHDNNVCLHIWHATLFLCSTFV